MRPGFEALVGEIPENRVPVTELAAQARVADHVVRTMHEGGLRSVPVDPGPSLADLVRRALVRLGEQVRDLSGRCHGVLLAHSLPVLAPAWTYVAGRCLAGLGLEEVPRCAVGGQPCASFHAALQLASDWLVDAPPTSGILLIGADRATTPAERLFFGSAMGDAAVAGFLTASGRAHRVLACSSQAEIVACDGVHSEETAISRFRELNPLWIRQAIEDCVASAGLRLEDMALIVPHTPYLRLGELLAKVLRLDPSRILMDYLPSTGHLNSHDSFIHYLRAVTEGRIRQGDRTLLVNPGFGGTCGVTILERGSVSCG